jgi:hypothetical protein
LAQVLKIAALLSARCPDLVHVEACGNGEGDLACPRNLDKLVNIVPSASF